MAVSFLSWATREYVQGMAGLQLPVMSSSSSIFLKEGLAVGANLLPSYSLGPPNPHPQDLENPKSHPGLKYVAFWENHPSPVAQEQ